MNFNVDVFNRFYKDLTQDAVKKLVDSKRSVSDICSFNQKIKNSFSKFCEKYSEFQKKPTTDENRRNYNDNCGKLQSGTEISLGHYFLTIIADLYFKQWDTKTEETLQYTIPNDTTDETRIKNLLRDNGFEEKEDRTFEINKYKLARRIFYGNLPDEFFDEGNSLLEVPKIPRTDAITYKDLKKVFPDQLDDIAFDFSHGSGEGQTVFNWGTRQGEINFTKDTWIDLFSALNLACEKKLFTPDNALILIAELKYTLGCEDRCQLYLKSIEDICAYFAIVECKTRSWYRQKVAELKKIRDVSTGQSSSGQQQLTTTNVWDVVGTTGTLEDKLARTIESIRQNPKAFRDGIRITSIAKAVSYIQFCKSINEIRIASEIMSQCGIWQQRQISINGEPAVTVKYDACNPFAVIKGDFGRIQELPGHATVTAQEELYEFFNSLSESFNTFMENIPAQQPGVSSDISPISNEDRNNYTLFYNQAMTFYGVSDEDPTNSAVIGINVPCKIIFGDDAKLGQVDFQSVIANLFGFCKKNDFVRLADVLSTTYAEYKKNINNPDRANKALENGCFYTKNDSFIFPFALNSNLGFTVLMYVILDKSGHVFVWVDNIISALRAIYLKRGIINELWGKNILLDKPEKKDYKLVRESNETSDLVHEAQDILVSSFYRNANNQLNGNPIDRDLWREIIKELGCDGDLSSIPALEGDGTVLTLDRSATDPIDLKNVRALAMAEFANLGCNKQTIKERLDECGFIGFHPGTIPFDWYINKWLESTGRAR